MPLPDPTPENIEKVKRLLEHPDLSDETRQKMQAWVSEHRSVTREGADLPEEERKNYGVRQMPEPPPLSRELAPLGKAGPLIAAGLTSLGSAASGLDDLFLGIPHRVAANLPGPTMGPPGLLRQPGETTSETISRLGREDPLSHAAGSMGTLLMGGVPALIHKGLTRVAEHVGPYAARLEALAGGGGARAADYAEHVAKAAVDAGRSSLAKQAALKAATGAGTAVASGGIEDAAQAADEALQGKPVDMSMEGEKMAIRALLGAAGGGIGGALGARAAANMDPSTAAGSGGVAQKLARIRRMGGDVDIRGVRIPPSVKPLYQEAMAGGTEITPPLNKLQHENALPSETMPAASHVEDVVAEKALGPVQRGIAEADRGQAQRFQAIDDAFYGSPETKSYRFEAKNIGKTLQRFAQARTFADGSQVPYANSGEPIRELNTLYNVGAPIRGMDKRTDLLAHPGSFALPLKQARDIGFNVPAQATNPMSGMPGPEEEAFVIVTPKQVSPEQFEQAMAGINNAAKAAQVKGSPDALHAELQQAGFRDRDQIPWPKDVPFPQGLSREVAFTIPGDRGSTTLKDWAAVQAQKSEKLSDLERDLFFMGTTPAEATNATTGPRAILNSLKTIGEPGSSRAERALQKFAVNQPGGREALENMESINMIEGPSGLRNKAGAAGPNPFSKHNREAIGLRLDPTMRALGGILPRAGAAVPLDDKKAIQMLLQSYGIGAQ